MKRPFFALILGTSVALVACGGSNGGSNPYGGGVAPTTAPSTAPGTSGSDVSIPQAATVKGATTGMGWVTAGSSVVALYTFSSDTAGTPTCTGGCANVWPPYAVAAGDAAVNNMAPCANATQQWCYQGRPLYKFSSDTPATLSSGTVINASGDGFNGFSAARPASNATPAPGGKPCVGYC